VLQNLIHDRSHLGNEQGLFTKHQQRRNLLIHFFILVFVVLIIVVNVLILIVRMLGLAIA